MNSNAIAIAHVEVDGLLEQSRGAAWCAVVDGTELYVNGNGVWSNVAQTCITYHVYYTVEFLQREFSRPYDPSPNRPRNAALLHHPE